MEKPNQRDKERTPTKLKDEDHIQGLPVTVQYAPTPTLVDCGFDIEMLELQEVTVGSEDSEEEKVEVGQFQEEEEKEEEKGEKTEKELVLQEIRGEIIFTREVQEEDENRESNQEDVEGEEVEEYVCVWVKEKEGNEDINHGEEWAGQNEWWQVLKGEKDEEDVFWLREVEEQLEGFYCEAREKAERGVPEGRERTQREDKEIVVRKSLKRRRRKTKKKRRVNKKEKICEDEKQNDEEDENGESNDCAAVQNKHCDTDEEQQQYNLNEKDKTKKVDTEENKKEKNADNATDCEKDLYEEKEHYNLNEKNNDKEANREDIREEKREEEQEVERNDTARNDKSDPEKEDGENDSGEERGDSKLEDSTSEEEVNWENEHEKETEKGERLEEGGRPREEEEEEEEGWSRYGELRDYNPQDGEWPLEDLDGQDEGDEEDEEAFYHPSLGWLGGDRVRVKGSLQTFGQLRGIRAEHYVREVTCAPPGVRVVLFLYKNGIPMCHLLENHLSRLAPKFPETKFLRIPARECVPNYPDSHLPTVFIYTAGRLVASLIGEWQCGGKNVLEEELKWTLATSGAFIIDSYADLYQDGTPSTSLSTDDYSDCSEQSDGDHSDSDCSSEDSERNESYHSHSNCSCSNSGDDDSDQNNHRSLIDSDASDYSDSNQGDQLEDHSDLH